MAKDIQIVGFRVGHETFGVPIAMVHEILRVPEITAVPDSPACVEGVINLRGKIVPVVDLRKRFGQQPQSNGKKNRILVAEVESKLVGLMVDTASEVLKLPPAEIEPPPSALTGGEQNYVSGVGKINGRLIILLDLKRILRASELRHLSEVMKTDAAGGMAAGDGS
jgi:purine-binding chemotaxis protein CheW